MATRVPHSKYQSQSQVPQRPWSNNQLAQPRPAKPTILIPKRVAMSILSHLGIFISNRPWKLDDNHGTKPYHFSTLTFQHILLKAPIRQHLCVRVIQELK